jgi:phage FluMu protein Com
MPSRKQKAPNLSGLSRFCALENEGCSSGCCNTQRSRRIADLACKPAKAPTARASGAEPSRNQKALQMLNDYRCGQCKRLLARVGEFTELQIKCSRCGTLNHVKAKSLERSPLSDMKAEFSASNSTQRCI